MKYLLSALLLVVAGISANAFVAPSSAPADHVLEAIEVFKRFFASYGLDNLDIDDETREFSLHVPEIFTAIAHAKGVKFTGLTDIDVRQINYDASRSVVSITFVLPHIYFSADLASVHLAFFDRTITGELKGSLNIHNIEFTVEAKFNGLVAESAVVRSSLGSILAAGTLQIQAQESYDLSERLLYFINTRIPRGINNFQDPLDELFGNWVVWYLNRVLEIEA